MRVDHKLPFAGIALAGAMSVLIAGCGDRQAAAPTQAASVSTSAGTQIDDTVITTKVKSALLADPDIKSFDLKVETRKGMVQLSGFVDNHAQIERAIAATRAVEGVASVENGISVKEGSTTAGNTVDDSIITTKVKAALLADPNVKSSDIAVVTRKGAVQLSGFVDSQAQVERALAIVNKVDGVTKIDNEMSIKN